MKLDMPTPVPCGNHAQPCPSALLPCHHASCGTSTQTASPRSPACSPHLMLAWLRQRQSHGLALDRKPRYEAPSRALPLSMYACRCLSAPVCACVSVTAAHHSLLLLHLTHLTQSPFSSQSVQTTLPCPPSPFDMDSASVPTYVYLVEADRCSDPEDPPFCACKSPRAQPSWGYKGSLSLHAYYVRASAVSQTDNRNQIPPRQIPASRMSSSSNLTGSLLAAQAVDCIDNIITEVTCSSYGAKMFFSRTRAHHHRRQPFIPHPSNPPA
jgi:hypothetical protein